MEGRGEVLILSSNNYLGLCDEPAVVEAGIQGLRDFGAGTGSVRFICGTFTVHRALETALARFVGTEASMSYVSAWNANEGLTASIVEAGDFVISDALNHASIIDSIRLAKAITKCTTAVYAHGDLDDLVAKLRANAGARRRIIWTDGVFSMEGSIAKLPQLLQIARDHDAILVMDDSHATGVLGATGRGTAEHFGVLGGRRTRRGSGGALRHADAALAPAALLERAPADGRRERPGLGRVHRSASGARHAAARECALFSRRDPRGRVLSPRRGHADRPDHHR
jgi:glycine C-acetyltransferase